MTLENLPSQRPTHWHTEAPVPVGWMRQFEYFLESFARIKNVPGDLVECGLGEGNTFAMMAYLIGSNSQENNRTLWGFDSFQGWPEPSLFDASPRQPQAGEWKISDEMVKQRFAESGIYKNFPNLKIKLVPGFLRDTLPNFSSERLIAFLHLDVDLYEGYRDALRYLFPLVATGGIVAFDEYKEFPNRPEYGNGKIEKWPGCSKAVDDFFRGRPEQIQYSSKTRKYFVIKASS